MSLLQDSMQYECDIALKQFIQLTETPEAFLSVLKYSEENPLIDQIKSSLKRSYDFAKSQEPPSKKCNTLPELIVENFDLEQIWQQIELQNEEIVDKNIMQISKILTSKNLLFKEIQTVCSDEKNEVIESVEEDSEVELHDISEDEGTNDDIHENISKSETNRKQKASIVDDDFFKLEEMEQFLNKEEVTSSQDVKKISNNDSDSEVSVDLFKEESSDEDEIDNSKNPKYKDFFVPNTEEPKQKRNKFFQEIDSDNEEDEQIKSSLELREERLKKKIEDLEEQALSDKPWQLKGEVTADKRPQNSLLEEVVDFDLTARPAPVITEKTTLQLEDIIKQRIKDKVFDSVIKKVKPIETPLEFKKKLILEQEKSKESLAQIYEKEYLQQKEALDPSAVEKEEKEEPQLHREIKMMMNSLFSKLDALSNFHYTPKPVAPELKIITNTPAINMEEVAPVATSDATLLAPEEIQRKSKGDPVGRNERSDTDKKRERRKKKLKQKIHAEAKKKKELLGLGNKYAKIKTKKAIEKAVKDKSVDKMEENDTKRIKSSSAFFNRLQEEVESQVKARKLEKNRVKHVNDVKKIKL